MSRYLITSALPYINGVKHLGNLIGSLLPADVYARHLRQQGEEVLYISGTDEHGTPAEIAAQEAGVPIEKFCHNMYEKQKDIFEKFGISTDYYGRSSSRFNHKLTQDFFLKLYANGYIYEKEIEQFYSNVDKRYLPDRYVIGICPSCGYDKARGDQCESCGRLHEPHNLLNPRSSISGSRDIVMKKTKHLFLQLADLQEKLSKWLDTRKWSSVTSGIAHKWLKEGLEDRCITRDLHWGVPVPLEGFEDKVFYVWFDAPNAYISMTQEWAEAQDHPEDWKKWWKESDEILYVQFMAKDNVPFHAILWPAILIGLQEDWKLVDVIHGINWLKFEGRKFSTSQGVGIFNDTALKLYPADYWRYYLLSIAPESDDSNFTIEHFAATINKDLANILGNFVSRVIVLCHRYFYGKIPPAKEDILPRKLFKSVSEKLAFFDESLRNLKFRQAVKDLRSLYSIGNEYITEEEPWKLYKEDLQSTGEVLSSCLNLIYIFGVATASIIPTTAEKLFAAIGEKSVPRKIPFSFIQSWKGLESGRQLPEAQHLFEKIDDDAIAKMKRDF